MLIFVDVKNAIFFIDFTLHFYDFKNIFFQFYNFKLTLSSSCRNVWFCRESSSWCFDNCRDCYDGSDSSFVRFPNRVRFHKEIMARAKYRHIGNLARYDVISGVFYF